MAAVAAVLALMMLVTVPAMAQESPATTDVAGEVEEPTTTTTEVDETTTTTEAEEVAGVTAQRDGALPITGGDIGGAALIGLALTGVGVALAAGARRRRMHTETLA